MGNTNGIFTVCFIGNLRLENVIDVLNHAESIAENLIKSQRYVNFLIFHSSISCQFFYSAICRAALKYDNGNSSIVIIKKTSTDDEINKTHEPHTEYLKLDKASDEECYKHMIDKSDLCVFCISDKEDEKVNSALRYAKENNKIAIDLITKKFFVY